MTHEDEFLKYNAEYVRARQRLMLRSMLFDYAYNNNHDRFDSDLYFQLIRILVQLELETGINL